MVTRENDRPVCHRSALPEVMKEGIRHGLASHTGLVMMGLGRPFWHSPSTLEIC